MNCGFSYLHLKKTVLFFLMSCSSANCFSYVLITEQKENNSSLTVQLMFALEPYAVLHVWLVERSSKDLVAPVACFSHRFL